MELFLDILIDAVKDTLLVVPFLLVTYLAMEWLEHKTGDRAANAVARAGKAGPAVGALLGAVPQCGFSAMASTFYAGRVITLGTLFAVFLSTSDEMLPIFIAEQVPVATILAILAVKVVIGMICGFVIDFVLRRRAGSENGKLRIHDLCEQANCLCEERCEGATHDTLQEHVPHDHDHCGHEHGSGSIIMSAVKHTLQITLFVFLITLALNACFELVGAETLAAFIGSNELLSVAASALVGLIPNCAASVLIADLYVEGVLGAGAMMAGLLPAAGVGLLVLLRTNRSAKENVAIVVALFAIGVLCGACIEALGVVF